MAGAKICPQCGDEFGAEQRFCPKDGSPLRPTQGDDPLIGSILAERYQILEVLGEGGMGRVYLAEHVRMGRRSAVKVINPALAVSADVITRFNREAANASRINHPNVAAIYDFGETPDGTLYLAMEFIEGETLTTIIEREGAIPLQQAALIGKQIADALAAAHHLGIVHRDLKPDNIMVARHLDGSDWVKVVDFGIAKTVQGNSGDRPSQTVTTAGVSLGTPEYMSPEQLAGERLDARTDIYSLGLVLFNMLTADLPYPRVTSKETLIRRLTLPPRTLSEVRPNVAWSPALQDVLTRSLAPEVDDRYASVTEFGQALVAAAAGAPADQTVRLVTGADAAQARRSAGGGKGMTRPLAEPAARKPFWTPAAIGAGIAVIGAAAVAFAISSRGTSVPSPTQKNIPAASATVASGTTAPAPAANPDSSAAPATRQATPPAVSPPSSPTVPAPAQPEMAQQAAAKSQPTVTGIVVPPASPDSERRGNRAGKGLGRLGRGGRAAADQGAQAGAANPGAARGWVHADDEPNGTKGLAANASDAQRVTFMGNEIAQHFREIVTYARQGKVQLARQEYREAGSDLALVQQLFPTDSGLQHIRDVSKQGYLDAINACNAAHGDTTIKGFDPSFQCMSLLPAPARRGGAGGGGRQQ